jgi:integrase
MQSESTVPARAKRANHPVGIEVRHKKQCASQDGRRCSCKPTYSAVVVLGRVNGRPRKKRKPFPSEAEAVAWRNEALVAIQNGKLRANSPITVRAAAERFIDGARGGAIRNRSGDIYKPSALRGIDEAFRLRIVPDLGARKLADVKRADLQRLVSRMQAAGQSPSTVRNTVNAVRALYRWAAQHDLVETSPTLGLALPAVRGRRERIASPQQAERLLAALSETERPLWATALYTGLRRGELRALDWAGVDFERGVIHVSSSWDNKEGEISPKSAAGTRDVPIGDTVRTALMRHRLAQGRGGQGLVFGRSAKQPFNANTVQSRADRAWNASGRERITLHECRHTYASLMIASSTRAEDLKKFMGHASITVTVDRYGHLMPGAEQEAASKLDAYLREARTAS